MSEARRKVQIGAAIGMAVVYGAGALLCGVWPEPLATEGADIAARLAVAAHLALWPVILVLILSFSIGLGRIGRGFIDPLDGPGDRALEIDRRVLTNSIEQSLVFVVALTALATRAPTHQLKLLPILTFFFVIGRVAFWVGYRIRPEYRAAGMAITYNVNFIMVLLALLLGQ
jgi:uncharacterized membrane protein YecN with MAPEG domain